MTTTISYPLEKWFRRLTFINRSLVIFLLLILVSSSGKECFSQDEPEYDEISVLLNVQQIGAIEIPGVVKGNTVYLPVSNIFDFLRIRNTMNPGMDSISGFFIIPAAKFLITRVNSQIIYKEKLYQLHPDDFIKTETNLYLRSKYFGEVFGLDCSFNFRALSVILNTKLELPVIREMRQEMMRANISRLKGEEQADSIIGRRYPVFHWGMADWSVISTQQVGALTDTRVNLSLGGILFGGETDITINYSSVEPFTEKQQYYLWRYANNDHKVVRQVMAGKINSQATSSIYAPVVGAQVTNTPTTYRRSFGSYQLSDRTEPGWIVELYVNNVLVDYVKADASGFFTFQVPLVYGNTAVKLRFYGPWGEEKAKEQNINIPFNFLPPKELEYTVSAGFVEDSTLSRFSRGNVNYGLSRRLTIGGGVEYLTSVTSGNTMPFLNMSLRLASSLLISGEYTYGVRFKGLLNYRMPSNLQFELMYLNYNKNQTAINYNILEERKAVISMPVIGKNFSSFMRFTFDQLVLPETQSTTLELLLSGAVFGVNANLTTYALFSEMTTPYIYSNFSMAFRLPARFVFTPQAQYQYNQSQFISLKAELEKHLFRNGYANISFERNFLSNISNLQLGIRYDFSFAQTGVTFRNSNRLTSVIESARGSLINEPKVHYVGVHNRTSVGRGGIVILPYLDVNCNNRRDKNEPKVYDLNIAVNGGRVEFSERDTTIRIFDLEPYTSYLVELDKNSFDNIAWQIRKQTYSIAVDPNQLKLVEVPVSVAGEASGMVYMKGPRGQFGQGRIIICFYDENSKLVSRTISEAEGFFSFLGLAPGKYTVRIDSSQLQRLKLTSSPESTQIEIRQSRDGDVVDDLEFILTRVVSDSSMLKTQENKTLEKPVQENNKEPEKTPQKNPETKPDQKITPEKIIPLPEKKQGDKEIKNKPVGNTNSGRPSGYMIQAGAFRSESYAKNAQTLLKKETGKNVNITSSGEFFKVLVSGFKDKQDALNLLPLVTKLGYIGAFIIFVM